FITVCARTGALRPGITSRPISAATASRATIPCAPPPWKHSAPSWARRPAIWPSRWAPAAACTLAAASFPSWAIIFPGRRSDSVSMTKAGSASIWPPSPCSLLSAPTLPCWAPPLIWIADAAISQLHHARRQTTIHGQHLAGDEARFARRHEHHGRGDVLGFAPGPLGYALPQPVGERRIVPKISGQLGSDVARR